MAKITKCSGPPGKQVCFTYDPDCVPPDPACVTTISARQAPASARSPASPARRSLGGTNYVLGGLGHTAYHHVGDTSSSAVSLARTAAVGAAAFHGYRRNKSVLWAVIWAVLAGVSPLVTTGVAVAQGFGKPKGK
jgi:hypothetical protein